MNTDRRKERREGGRERMRKKLSKERPEKNKSALHK
jgi:hypothetical protein